MREIEIIRPDDWHVHFRDNEIMNAVVPLTSKNFSRAIVMPNLLPPILNGRQALEYKERIKRSIPEKHYFEPLMTIYLTENTNINEIQEAYENSIVFAAKLYPAGATTNSESGVKNIKNIMGILEKMSEIKMPLLIHGEVTNNEIDIFDREKIFIDQNLDFICKELPELIITLEHITTKDAVMYINEGNENLAATITPHHLALNRNALFAGGLRPHKYCLPILKRESDRKFLVKAATSGNKKFFLGTDTAPHLKTDKESSCGCAGIFNAPNCIEILAEIFDRENSIETLEKFTSINGANHYNCEINSHKIKLQKSLKPVLFDKSLYFKDKEIKIFQPEFPVFWNII